MTVWNSSGIRLPTSERARPSGAARLNLSDQQPVVFPFELEDVRQALRAGDLDRLVDLKAKLSAFMALARERETGFQSDEIDAYHQLFDGLKAGIAELTRGTVAMSNGAPYQRFLSRAEDETVDKRTEQARKALSEKPEVRAGDDPARKVEREHRPLAERLENAKRALRGSR